MRSALGPLLGSGSTWAKTHSGPGPVGKQSGYADANKVGARYRPQRVQDATLAQTCQSVSTEPPLEPKEVNLCVFCHGMGGDRNDWDVWMEWLGREYPDWILKPCESVTKGSYPLIGDGLDTLANLLAQEVLSTIAEVRAQDEDPLALTLHCVGHSMGGVILRGAFHRIFEVEVEPYLKAGVFMSLSSPHLGVQASWGAPQDMWRNLAWTLRGFGPQIPQLAMQDKRESASCATGINRPYLVSIADAEGPHIAALKRFQRRICITMGCKDIVIPAASGSLWTDRAWTEPTPPLAQVAGWGFEAMSSYVPDEPDEGTSAGHSRTPSGRSASSSSARSESDEDRTPVHLRPRRSTCRLRTPSEADWVESADHRSWFPRQILEGLLTMSWERIVVQLHLEQAKTHVFLLGKESEQHLVEHMLSKECVGYVAQMLVSATLGVEHRKLKCTLGLEPEFEDSLWMSSLKLVTPEPCEKPEFNDPCKWTVAIEEGANNVKFYAFKDELCAKQYFEALGLSKAFSTLSRILFNPDGKEVGRRGALSSTSVGAFTTIHNCLVCPTSDMNLDGRWIVVAEHGLRNVKCYHLESEDLARQFSEKAFLPHVVRVLFDPKGTEVSRSGWNRLTTNYVTNTFDKAIRPQVPQQP